jgi:hypothetical protein
MRGDRVLVTKELIDGTEVLLELAPDDRQYYDENELSNEQPFSWGYGGSGPSNLSRAILWDYFADDPERAVRARNLSVPFLHQQIADKDGDEGWTLRRNEITKWLRTNYGKARGASA